MYCDLWLQYIKVRKLFKGENYSRVETIRGSSVTINRKKYPQRIHFVLSCKRDTPFWSIILPARTRSLVSLVICNQDILSPSHATMQPLSVGLKRICRFHIYKALLCSSIVTPWSTLKSVPN